MVRRASLFKAGPNVASPGCGLTYCLPVLRHLGRTKSLLKPHPVPRVLSHLTEQGFLCLSHQLLPATMQKDCHTALIGSFGVASHDSWWLEGPVCLLFSLCQASPNTVGSCIFTNDAIDTPTVGSKYSIAF